MDPDVRVFGGAWPVTAGGLAMVVLRDINGYYRSI